MPPDVESLIPHRPPFRFVDRLVNVDAGGGELELELEPDDPRLSDGRLPSIYLVEALAQATAAFHGATRPGGPHSGVLAELVGVRFFDAARGGDTIKLQVRRDQALGGLVRFAGVALRGRHVLAQATLTVLCTAEEET